jgi:putative MFS transporter
MEATTNTSTVEAILQRSGFTHFHRRIVLVTGIAWTFVAMEILLISFTLPVFQAAWNLSGFSLGLIGSAALMGSFVGSLFWGRLADRIGRRSIFQVTILWYSVFVALTAASWNPVSLFAFRFLSGVGLGGMLVVDPTLLSEYLPPQVRGRFLVFLDFFWPIGNLIALGLAYYFLEVAGGAWRPLFLVAAVPAFLAFISRTLVPESPYYLARKGRAQEAAQVLTRVTGQVVDSAVVHADAGATRARVADLLSGNLRQVTLATLVAWIALNFGYYGLFLWLPGALAAVRGIQLGNIYILLLLSVLAQFPGYLSAMWLVEAWGRKKTLVAFLILGGLSGLVFATATNYPIFVASLFFVGFFNLGAWGAVYPYTSEVFPTVLRATAFGLAEGVGKITAILGPTVFGALKDATGDVIVPLLVVAVVMAVGGVVTGFFGRETRGAPLL